MIVIWIAWYQVLHKLSGYPVVMVQDGEREYLRLVRMRLRFGSMRPCIKRWGVEHVLVSDGSTYYGYESLRGYWRLLFGTFKPSVRPRKGY